MYQPEVSIAMFFVGFMFGILATLPGYLKQQRKIREFRDWIEDWERVNRKKKGHHAKETTAE